MSTKIKTFHGKDGNVLLPRTHTKAVLNDAGASVDEILSGITESLDNKTEKVRIDIVGTTGSYQFKKGNEVLNFKQLNDLLQNSPDFCVFVYDKREHRCTMIDLDSNPKQMRFVAPLLNDGILKTQAFYVTSNNGVDITAITSSDINCENSSNKRTNLENANDTTYPTTKAVADAADDLSQKVGKISGDVETLSGIVETHEEKLSDLGEKVVSASYSFDYSTTGAKRELVPHITAGMTITDIIGDIQSIVLDDVSGVGKTIHKTNIPYVADKEYVKISAYKTPSIEITVKYERISNLQEVGDRLNKIDKEVEEITEIIEPKNLVDWSNLPRFSGTYYKGSTGTIAYGFSSGGRFGLIAVKPNTRYYLSVKGDMAISANNGLEVGIVYYSANTASTNNYLGGISASNKAFVTPEGCEYIGISYYNNRVELGEIMLNYGEERGEYEEWHEPTLGVKIPNDYIVGRMIKEHSIPKSKIIDDSGDEAKINVHLPKNIYAAEGDTLQLFYKSVMECANPYMYHIVVVCAVGKNFPRYYEFTPASDQLNKTYALDFYVYDNNGNELAHEISTINVVSKSIITTLAKNILVIGDSVYSSGAISAEIYRRLHDTSGNGTPSSPIGWGKNNISMIGKLVASGVHQEARGGWSWSMYATNANKAKRFYVRGVQTTPSEGATYTIQGLSQSSTYYFTVTERNITGSEGNIRCEVYGGYVYPTFPTSGVMVRRSGTGDASIEFTSVEDESGNPFWNESTNALDFVNYSTLYCDDASIDVLVSQLGINDFRSLADVDTKLESHVKPFIRRYHEQYPNGKFIIGSLPLQSPTGGLGTNNGANATYNFFQIQNRYFYYLDKINEMIASDEFSSYVVLADTMAEFDSENNYPYADKPVNNRVTDTTEKLGTNAQHPTEIGKLNLADSMFRAIVFTLKV